MSDNYTLDRILTTFEKFLANDDRKREERRLNKGEFYYIPLSLDQFLAQAQYARAIFDTGSDAKPKFIDVGCGIGTKLVAAATLGFNVYGVELDPRYVKVARKLLKIFRAEGHYSQFIFEVYQENAMRHDYSAYDVIYFYCPFSDPDKEKKLEQRIVRMAKPGTIILGNLRKDTELWDNRKLVRPLSKRRSYSTDMAFVKV